VICSHLLSFDNIEAFSFMSTIFRIVNVFVSKEIEGNKCTI
jgi:hypothetical protein